MRKLTKYSSLLLSFLLILTLLSSCKKLYEADQELNITEDKLYGDWYEYRSAMMGLYGLQQRLVEQLLILGELRGDLLQITPNADADMIEIHNFSTISKTNKYASPTNFFKLISACNRFIRIVSTKHPEVLNMKSAVSDYDKIYGEALCMRAWAYFNAVRIYGKVPFIHEALTNIEDVEKYVNSPGTFVSTVKINYNIDGYHNDTIKNDTVVLEKIFLNEDQVIKIFTNQLETQIKNENGAYGVGVDYAYLNNDPSWEVTTWHPFSMRALLGHMYLTLGDYVRANYYFENIVKNNSENNRYELDRSFQNGSWRNIFTGIDNREHIYTIDFSKDDLQQNQLQDFFVNKFMIKPTKAAISKWERIQMGQVISIDNVKPELSKMISLGYPGGDVYRGYLSSYIYKRIGGGVVSFTEFEKMSELKFALDFRNAYSIMDGTDTVVYKYVINKNVFESDTARTLNKDVFAKDANYIIYRGAGIHLYLAEIFTYWMKVQDNGILSTDQGKVKAIINDGAYYGGTAGRTQLGVRGRVGIGNINVISGNIINYDGLNVKEIEYIHNPYTNKIIGYKNYSGDILAQEKLLESRILDEKAQELAFEGERFYDLMRFAKRRGDNSILADRVSAKFPNGQREVIRQYLMNSDNWYIKYFE